MPLTEPLDTTGMGNSADKIVSAVAIVTDPRIRMAVVEWIATTHGAILVLLLLSLFVRRSDGRSPWRDDYAALTPLLAFVFLVLGWFMALSIGFQRYAAPALICAAGPVALAIAALYGYTSSSTPSHLKGPMRVPRKYRRLFITVLLAMGAFNLLGLAKYQWKFRTSNRDLLQTATFLNERASPGTVVETYDSALFHLLNVPYLFPPDEYHVLFLQSRSEARKKSPLHSARYLVLGYWSRAFEIAQEPPDGYFKLASFGDFAVYERADAT
jgi:uncharacterized membrane protein YqjE